MLAFKLDRPQSPLKYIQVFIPIFLFLTPPAIGGTVRVVAYWVRRCRTAPSTEAAEGTLEVMRPFLGSICQIGFLVLLALKLDGGLTASWWMVLLPLWALLALFFLRLAHLFELTSAKTQGTKEEKTARRGFAIAGSLVGVLMLLALLLLSLLLGGQTSYSAVVVFIPGFVLVFLFCCCGCCACCSAAVVQAAQEGAER